MSSDPRYIHGTDAEEQSRLSLLNDLLNPASIEALDLKGGEKILDVGSGLGQFTRLMARAAGNRERVVAIEQSPEQLATAMRLAREAGEEGWVEFRRGDATDLPLSEDEWGSFDVAHARFLLEHLTDPLAVVRAMVRAVRPGGRIVLEDDDHAVLRLAPEPAGVLDVWRAYYRTFEAQGNDPYIGRKLVSLIHRSGAVPRANRSLFFGSCAGNPTFDAMVKNFAGVIGGARDTMIAHGLSDGPAIDAALAAFEQWGHLPDATVWYTTSWAEGLRPA